MIKPWNHNPPQMFIILIYSDQSVWLTVTSDDHWATPKISVDHRASNLIPSLSDSISFNFGWTFNLILIKEKEREAETAERASIFARSSSALLPYLLRSLSCPAAMLMYM